MLFRSHFHTNRPQACDRRLVKPIKGLPLKGDNENEFLGVIGHTGSGKSTLMQCIDALIEPDEGKIYIDDIEITSKSVSKPAVRQKVGLVFQYPEYQLFEETAAKDFSRSYPPR